MHWKRNASSSSNFDVLQNSIMVDYPVQLKVSDFVLLYIHTGKLIGRNTHYLSYKMQIQILTILSESLPAIGADTT